jgi:hypothetical protein
MPDWTEVQIFTAMLKAFEKSHANCPKIWKEPEVDTTKSEIERANFWWQCGERGISSETIWYVMTGKRNPGGCHPWDPDDFRRCYALLKAVPEWRGRLQRLKSLSKAWSNLVDNWDALEVMLEELMAGRKSRKMYDFMQTLIN